MIVPKPADIGSYQNWLKNQHKIDNLDQIESHYSIASLKIRNEFTSSAEWQIIQGSLDEIDASYRIAKGNYPLLGIRKSSKVLIKPFSSMINKTYRKNVIFNSKWDDQPDDGWILPNNWFERINDIVRTSIVVKYLDGVVFLSDELSSLFDDHEINYSINFKAREEGYYASHLLIHRTYEIPDLKWNTFKVEVATEIQIRTEIQDLIRRLLHKYYKEKRLLIDNESIIKPWQWKYQTDEFISSYLGHIIHYLEGMLVEVRDRNLPEDK